VVDVGLIAEILTIILALLSLYFGSKYKKAKQVMKELAEAIDKELKRVLKEWKDLLEIWRDLL